MAARSFDSYKYVKEFKEAGLPEAQAAAIVAALVACRDYDLSQLATKEQQEGIRREIDVLKKDLDFFRQEAKNDNENLRHEMKQEFVLQREYIISALAKQDATLKTWMISMLITFVGLIVTLIVLKLH